MLAQIWTIRGKPEPWPILALVKVEKRQTKRLRKFTLKHFMAFTINKNLNVPGRNRLFDPSIFLQRN